MPSTLKKLLIYLLTGYALIGFVLVPLILKPQLTALVEKELKAKIVVESLFFNPFVFKLSLHGVKLSAIDASPLVSFDSFVINLDPSSLVYGTIKIKEILLEEPKIYLVYNSDKSINLLQIIKKSTKKEETDTNTTLPRVIVDRLKVRGGALYYEDYTQQTPFSFSFEDIGFSLENIDTKESNSTKAEFRFYSTLGDGGFVDMRSKILSIEPFVVQGSLDFQASKLYTEWRYIKDRLQLEVADGKISFHTDYYLNSADLQETKIKNLRASVEKLRIKPKEKHQDILNLENFSIQGGLIEPMKHTVLVKKISLDGLRIKALRDKNGTIDWVRYTAQPEDKQIEKSEKSIETKEKWSVKIKEIALQKIAVNFQDRAIQPVVQSDINELNLYASNVTLAGEEPLEYKLDMLINGDLTCHSEGTVVHKTLHLESSSECRHFDLTHYNPYIEDIARKSLKKFDIKLQQAEMGFDANVTIEKRDKALQVNVNSANIVLDKLDIRKKRANAKILRVAKVSTKGIVLDTLSKSISVDKIEVDAFNLHTKRYKNGKINLENLVLTHKLPKSKKENSQKGYSIHLKEFAINSAKISFEDKTLHRKSNNTLDRINIHLYDIDAKKGSWLRYTSSLRVNKRGYIKAKGKLRHTPLKQRGSFQIQNIDLRALNPYIQEESYLKIEDGKISLKGRTSYAKSSKRADLRVDSSFRLQSLFVNDLRDNSLLLSLNDVDTKAFTFEYAPNRLYINELNVDAFYVNAQIDANKSMNFSQLMKPSLSQKRKELPKENSQDTAFPVKILKTNIASGSAKFADLSIPIQFKTHIHNLDGVLYSLSNTPGETMYVDIVGEVDKYGSTRLKGSIDLSNPKLYTDLDFNFKNLDLNSLSGYSATFAGHEIDSGKLYLDLGYNIVDSALHGSNTIVMKKVVLGREIDDENVTVLPLGFVLGLLEDSDGVIDIDMPVEGDLNNPDFKYGKLILSTIGGLITKAVTSPFKFLGSVMGINADELEFISFEPAQDKITPPQREKLDQIAKMMTKKPKIDLSISGSYNIYVDREALQLEKLIDLVMQKSGLKNRKEHESVMTTSLLEDIYKELYKEDSLDALQERLHAKYSDKEFERAYHKSLIVLCRDKQRVDTKTLVMLAQKREEAIYLYLTQEKFIEQNRITKKAVIEVDDAEMKRVDTKMQIEVK